MVFLLYGGYACIRDVFPRVDLFCHIWRLPGAFVDASQAGLSITHCEFLVGFRIRTVFSR